jgi:hypothetical protein
MSPDFAATLRTNRAAQAAAAAAVLAALVGLAKVVAGHSSKPVVTSKTVAAAAVAPRSPAQIALAPNETLVAPAGKAVEPLMPRYAKPDPPPPAPSVPDQPQSPEAASAEALAAAVEPPLPMAPLPAPAPSLSNAPPSSVRCMRCGEVMSLTVWPDMAEVNVRFEDGTMRVLRGPLPSPWRVGDRVRLEQGRLVRD